MALPDTKFGKATVIPDPTGFVNNFLLEVDLSLQNQAWWDDVNTTDGTRGRASKDNGNVELSTVWIEFNPTAQTGRVIIIWTGAILNGETTVRIYAPNTRNEPVLNTDPFGSHACLDLANVLLYSPNGGNDDRSSNAFTLTENGGVVSGDSVGKNGAATNFDGVDDFLSVDISDQDQPLTFMAWFNTPVSTGNELISMGGWPSTQDYFDVSYESLKPTLFIREAFPTDSIIGSNSLSLNVWNHQAGVFASTTSMEVFGNGVSGGSKVTAAISPVISKLTLGALQADPSPSFHWEGLLQELFVFTEAKSEAWINYEYLQTNDNASFWTEWTFSNEQTDFCIRAVSRLIEQFEQKINITKYLCALITPFDDLKEVFDDLQFKRNLNNAEGAQLDGLGEIIGLARGGLSDDDYRIALNAQIIINGSNGEVESIIAAMLVFAGGTFVDLIELYPAGIIVVSDGTVPTNIIQLLEQVAQAGIRLEVYATYGETPFAFAGDAGDPADPSTEGFSEPNYAPDAGLGGSFVEKFS